MLGAASAFSDRPHRKTEMKTLPSKLTALERAGNILSLELGANAD